MIHGRFTLLGTEQSGKSSLIKSFCEQVNLSHQLFAKISNCPSAIGVSETSECFFQDKQMDVYQNEKEIISVQLSDYNGMMLSSKPNSSEFEMLNNTIDNSNVLYVLINGEFFNENSLEKIIQNSNFAVKYCESILKIQ